MSRINRVNYLAIKDECRQKLNRLEDTFGDTDQYHQLTQRFWRLDDYLDYKGMKKLDRELTDILKA